jgi:hypothetical protein
METCEKFEEWWHYSNQVPYALYNEDTKALAWQAWEKGIASFNELLKELALELKKEPVSTQRFKNLLVEIPDAQRKEIMQFLTEEYDANGCKK